MVGIPFYGYRFTVGQPRPSPIIGNEVVKLLTEHPDARMEYHPEWSEHSIEFTNSNGQRETIYYPTPIFIQRRIERITALGASISIWEIGQGVDMFYDLL